MKHRRAFALILCLVASSACATIREEVRDQRTEVLSRLKHLRSSLPTRLAAENAVAADAASTDQSADQVVSYCDAKIRKRDDNATTTRRLSIAGIIVGATGSAAAGVSASISDNDTKTGLSIGTAIISAGAAALAGTQLFYRPADSGKIAKVLALKAGLEAAIDAAASAASDLDTAAIAVADQSRVVVAAKKAYDAAQIALAPEEKLKPLRDILSRETVELEARAKRQRDAKDAHLGAMKNVRLAIGALRAECIILE